jgi:peroxiredoxin
MGGADMNIAMRWLLVCGIVLSIYGCDDKLVGGLKVGEAAPKLPTRTLAEVGGDMSKVTTYRQPDARMYKYSLDKALTMGKPIVLEFATPAHCTVCDGQLQVVKALLDKYHSEVIFLHMDQYENPQAYRAYQVEGDPWTFVIDRKGVVRFQLAGEMLYSELDAQIKKVLVVPSKSVSG